MVQNKNAKFGHAVILGSSVAGLLAAAAAADYFERVTIIERDELNDDPSPRAGVPQGHQIHALLPAGLKNICKFFPGFDQDIRDIGAAVFDQLAVAAILTPIGWLKNAEGGDWLATRRPRLELALRKRVEKINNVMIEQGSVNGLVLDGEGKGRKVVGVKLRDGSQISGDLFVNATGRRTKVIDWLVEHGVSAPRETFLNSYIGYVTGYGRLPDGAFEGHIRAIGALPNAMNKRGVALFPTDNGLYTFMALGAMRDYPPRDREELRDYLKTSTFPRAIELLDQLELVSDFETYWFEGSLIRHWEEVEDLPARLVCVGDSMGSMNPMFGQGMSLASFYAVSLAEGLAESDSLDGIPEKVHNEMVPHVMGALDAIGGVDCGYEGAHWSEDFTPAPASVQERGLALAVLATQDGDINRAMCNATYNFDASPLASPEIQDAIDAWLAGDRNIPQFDPTRYPGQSERVADMAN